MSNKIITAEELAITILLKGNKDYSSFDRVSFTGKQLKELAVEFAKLHVEACKKEIAEDYTYYLKGDEGSEILDQNKFNKEAYPLENIK
jgi:ABC-type molybdate transport system substrate-binding protein